MIPARCSPCTGRHRWLWVNHRGEGGHRGPRVPGLKSAGPCSCRYPLLSRVGGGHRSAQADATWISTGSCSDELRSRARSPPSRCNFMARHALSHLARRWLSLRFLAALAYATSSSRPVIPTRRIRSPWRLPHPCLMTVANQVARPTAAFSAEGLSKKDIIRSRFVTHIARKLDLTNYGPGWRPSMGYTRQK